MLDYLRALWATNPVRISSVLAAVIVAVGAKLGVVLPEAGTLEAIALVVPIVLGGEVARSKVQPYTGEVGTPSDELLPGAHYGIEPPVPSP